MRHDRTTRLERLAIALGGWLTGWGVIVLGGFVVWRLGYMLEAAWNMVKNGL